MSEANRGVEATVGARFQAARARDGGDDDEDDA